MSAKTGAATISGAAAQSLAEQARQAFDMTDWALQKPPGELSEEIDVAERAIVHLRDGLIARLRQDNRNAEERARWRDALDQVNGALSLVVGIEYPAGGVHRKMLKLAHSTLLGVREAKLPE